MKDQVNNNITQEEKEFREKLIDAIIKNSKLEVVRLITNYSKLGIKDSKEIMDDSWDYSSDYIYTTVNNIINNINKKKSNVK